MEERCLPASSTILALVAMSLWSVGAEAQRLPGTVIPESYDLTFEPELATATFRGDETIHLRLQTPVTSITLNSAEIEFQEVKITSGRLTQTAIVRSDEEDETTTLTVAQPLPAGKVQVQIRFTGLLNDSIEMRSLQQANLSEYVKKQGRP